MWLWKTELAFLHSPQQTGPNMKYSIALAGVLIALMGPASAMEYLANGGFENQDFFGWDLFNAVSAEDDVVRSDNSVLGLNYGAQSGDWYLVDDTPDDGTLSQTFTDTAGQQLTVSGWTIGDKHTPGGLGEISYFFIGVLLVPRR